MGGAALLDSIQTLRSEGTTRRRIGSEELSIPTVSLIAFPDRYRHEATLPFGKLVTIVTAKGAFLTSDIGSMPLSEDQKFEVEDHLLRNPVILLRKRNDMFYEAEAEGRETWNGRAVERVRFSLGEWKTTTVFLDPVTFRIVGVRYPERRAPAGAAKDLTVAYDDYRKVGNLLYPFGATGTVEGRMIFAAKTEKITVDGPIPDEAFEMPVEIVPPPPRLPAASPTPTPK